MKKNQSILLIGLAILAAALFLAPKTLTLVGPGNQCIDRTCNQNTWIYAQNIPDLDQDYIYAGLPVPENPTYTSKYRIIPERSVTLNYGGDICCAFEVVSTCPANSTPFIVDGTLSSDDGRREIATLYQKKTGTGKFYLSYPLYSFYCKPDVLTIPITNPVKSYSCPSAVSDAENNVCVKSSTEVLSCSSENIGYNSFNANDKPYGLSRYCGGGLYNEGCPDGWTSFCGREVWWSGHLSRCSSSSYSVSSNYFACITGTVIRTPTCPSDYNYNSQNLRCEKPLPTPSLSCLDGYTLSDSKCYLTTPTTTTLFPKAPLPSLNSLSTQLNNLLTSLWGWIRGMLGWN